MPYLTFRKFVKFEFEIFFIAIWFLELKIRSFQFIITNIITLTYTHCSSYNTNAKAYLSKSHK